MMFVAMLTMLMGMVSIAVPAHAETSDDFTGFKREKYSDYVFGETYKDALKLSNASYSPESKTFSVMVDWDIPDDPDGFIEFESANVYFDDSGYFGGSQDCVVTVSSVEVTRGQKKKLNFMLPACASAYVPSQNFIVMEWRVSGSLSRWDGGSPFSSIQMVRYLFADKSYVSASPNFTDSHKVGVDDFMLMEGSGPAPSPTPTPTEPGDNGGGEPAPGPDDGDGDEPTLPEPEKDPEGSQPFPYDPNLGVEIKPMPDSPTYCITLSNGSQYCNYFYTKGDDGQICLFTPSEKGFICGPPDCSAKAGETWNSPYCVGGEEDPYCEWLGNPLTCIKSLIVPQEDWKLHISELAGEHSDRFPFGIFRSVGAFFTSLDNTTKPGGLDLKANFNLICPNYELDKFHGGIYYYDESNNYKPTYAPTVVGEPLYDGYIGCDSTHKYEVKFLEPGSMGSEIMKLARPLLTGAVLAMLTIGMWLSIGKSALKRLF